MMIYSTNFNNIPIAVYFPWIFNTSEKQQDVWRFLGPCWRRTRIGWWVNEVIVCNSLEDEKSIKQKYCLPAATIVPTFSVLFPWSSICWSFPHFPVPFLRCSTQFSNRCSSFFFVRAMSSRPPYLWVTWTQVINTLI